MAQRTSTSTPRIKWLAYCHVHRKIIIAGVRLDDHSALRLAVNVEQKYFWYICSVEPTAGLMGIFSDSH